MGQYGRVYGIISQSIEEFADLRKLMNLKPVKERVPTYYQLYAIQEMKK